MVARSDLTGQRFGRLIAIEYAGSDKHGQAQWRSRCDCGNVATVGAMHLKRRTTVSCGCYGRERYAASGRGRKKGEVVKYKAVHEALRRKRGPARNRLCMDCGKAAQEWSLRAEPTERHIGITDRGYPVPYSTRLDDYEPRCRRCHRLHDLRVKGVVAS